MHFYDKIVYVKNFFYSNNNIEYTILRLALSRIISLD